MCSSSKTWFKKLLKVGSRPINKPIWNLSFRYRFLPKYKVTSTWIGRMDISCAVSSQWPLSVYEVLVAYRFWPDPVPLRNGMSNRLIPTVLKAVQDEAYYTRCDCLVYYSLGLLSFIIEVIALISSSTSQCKYNYDIIARWRNSHQFWEPLTFYVEGCRLKSREWKKYVEKYENTIKRRLKKTKILKYTTNDSSRTKRQSIIVEAKLKIILVMYDINFIISQYG